MAETEFLLQLFAGGKAEGMPAFTAKVTATDPTEAVILIADNLRSTRKPTPEAEEKQDEELAHLLAALQQGGGDPGLESRVVQLEHGFQLTTKMLGTLQREIEELREGDFDA